MEKIAIISDVHGCYVSLEKILEDIERRKISRIFMLGDIVAKGSEPKKVLECIKEKCEIIIKGNCDDIIGGRKCSTDEHIWNSEKIGKDNIEYLNNLPLYYDFYMSGLKFRIIHASPNTLYESINYYPITNNISNEINDMFINTKFLNNIDSDLPDVVIFGHIHSPFFYRIKESNKMLINPGSVSNSCDIIKNISDKKLFSSYMILEGEYGSKKVSSISYEIVRIPFEYEKEIENLEKSDMPNKDMAIEELKTGIYKKR